MEDGRCYYTMEDGRCYYTIDYKKIDATILLIIRR
jgi:hypothetical protein